MIRIAESSSAAELTSLNKYVQEWHAARYPDIFKSFNRKEVQEVFEKWLKDKNMFNLVAYFNSDPAAYAVIRSKKNEESAFKYGSVVYELDQIAVLPEYRNKGIAQLLIKHLINVAKNEEVNEIVLDHWSENTVAKSLFLKMGFKNYREHMFLNVRS